MNIPGCTYCQPQFLLVTLNVRLRSKELSSKLENYHLWQMKAVASNEKEGFVKTLIGKHGELLGAHCRNSRNRINS